MTTPDPTVIGVLVTTITGMSTAIGVLWKTVMNHVKSIEDRLRQCEDDRNELWKALAEQAGEEVSTLQQRTQEGRR